MGKKRIAPLILILCLTGCGSLPFAAITSALGGSSSNDGVQVGTEDITIGQKKEDNDVETQIGDNQKAQTITNNDSGPNGFIILLIVLLAGWAIPTPAKMFNGIKNFFTPF